MITLNTEMFKDAVSKAIKGAGLNKLIPLTSMIAIKVENNQLTLITTDASNTLYIMREVNASTFYAVAYAEQLYKLITRITTDTIKLDVKDAVLIVKANGEYKLELPLDENGNTVVFPEDDLSSIQTVAPNTDISLATVKTILETNKVALATTAEEPCYMNYYVGDKVVSTDREKMCGLDISIFDDAKLISAQTMDLLDVMTDEKINVYIDNSKITFATKNCILVSNEAEGVDEYAIDVINTLLDEEFASNCKVNKSALIALLERIALFVGPYDKNAITLTFTEDGIDISSKQSSGIESIKYIESNEFKPYTCEVAIDTFLSQVKANASDTVLIQYGNERSIKLVDDKITQVIALLM